MSQKAGKMPSTRATRAIAEIKEQVQIEQWQQQIEERRAAGLSVAAWCEQQGISKTTYYYRLRKVREHLCHVAGLLPESTNEQQIVPLYPAVAAIPEGRIEIHCGDLQISFEGDTSPSALKAVIEALRSC